ncbi:glycine N-acyltransferase-like [Lissotriton helveticus]
MMLALESSEDRKKLEELLAQSVPESMKVYGSIFYINRGNPLNMEVLVDSWPDFKTVICKKRPEEMMDDTNIYINTYNVFTKDPENFRAMLWTTDVINWNQCLLIQGLQQCLNDVIMSIAESKGIEVESEPGVLFVRKIHAKVCEKSPKVNLEEEASAQTSSHLKARDDQPTFQYSAISAAEAEMVNAFWINGGNQNSLKIVRQCIQHLPNLCMRDPGGKPISWFVMDQTAEIRMGYTVPEYRDRGVLTSLFIPFIVSLHLQWDDFPYHFITRKQNVQIHSVAQTVGLRIAPCEYFKSICRPQGRETHIYHRRGFPKSTPTVSSRMCSHLPFTIFRYFIK